MSKLIQFYKGIGTDTAGRTHDEVLAFSDMEMEDLHDFIQWIFPLRTASAYNADAPLVSDADIAAFVSDPALQSQLLRSFDRFLRFVGLERIDGRVQPAPDFATQQDVWLSPNHNWLRVTRVLHSLRLLGLEQESRAFFNCIRSLCATGDARITPETMRYWQLAAPPAP